MKRGDLWWASLPAPWGRRPVALLSRDGAYTRLTWIMVGLITTKIRGLPTEVLLEPEADAVPRSCVINVDSIQLIRRDWLDEQLTTLRPRKLRALDRAIHFALALRSCSEPGFG
jgi:mRNA interferase MazF